MPVFETDDGVEDVAPESCCVKSDLAGRGGSGLTSSLWKSMSRCAAAASPAAAAAASMRPCRVDGFSGGRGNRDFSRGWSCR